MKLLKSVQNAFQIFLDTETTGLSYEDDRIVSISLVARLPNSKEVSSYYKEFSPDGVKLHPMAAEKNGFTDEYLSALSPISVNEVQEILYFMSAFIDSGHTCLIAHRAAFDFSMLQSTFKRLSDEEKKTIQNSVIGNLFDSIINADFENQPMPLNLHSQFTIVDSIGISQEAFGTEENFRKSLDWWATRVGCDLSERVVHHASVDTKILIDCFDKTSALT